MELLTQQILAGISTGAIYACMALAVVMIYQAIDHLNFAQGEMAMFSTFIAWQLIEKGVPYWLAFVITVIVSFIGGVAIERIVFKPIEHAPVLSHVVIFIALYSVINSMAGFIWDFTVKSFPSPFGSSPLFGSTLISSRLVGIRVSWMTALGWGMAAAIGSIGGMLIAPVVFLEPNMMISILLYGFAGAVLGGLTSPGGAVLGGFAVGVIENLAGTYIPVIGAELKLPIALVVIVVVLVFKPAGLFGRVVVSRV